MDVYDKLLPDDLQRNAVILASFLYHAAMRDDPLPRETGPRNDGTTERKN